MSEVVEVCGVCKTRIAVGVLLGEPVCAECDREIEENFKTYWCGVKNEEEKVGSNG